ncbi:hypothetical protein [Rubritalea tangerina]|uniref:Uncharacterized protein n=1 Tax=Rubritalea tangerina TaxID=430798 RepID=A0ABW4ZBA0_9BACT
MVVEDNCYYDFNIKMLFNMKFKPISVTLLFLCQFSALGGESSNDPFSGVEEREARDVSINDVHGKLYITDNRSMLSAKYLKYSGEVAHDSKSAKASHLKVRIVKSKNDFFSIYKIYSQQEKHNMTVDLYSLKKGVRHILRKTFILKKGHYDEILSLCKNEDMKMMYELDYDLRLSSLDFGSTLYTMEFFDDEKVKVIDLFYRGDEDLSNPDGKYEMLKSIKLFITLLKTVPVRMNSIPYREFDDTTIAQPK